MRLTLIILLFFIESVACVAQVNKANVCKYVYMIKVTQPGFGTNNMVSISTGFKLKGRIGLYTVLHGLLSGRDIKNVSITATRFLNDSTKSDQYCQNLQIDSVDIDRDYVHLICPVQQDCLDLFNGEGFEFSTRKVEMNDEVHIYGFPETPSLDGRPGKVLKPAMKNLETIAPDRIKTLFNSHNFPGIKVNVIKLDGTSIKRGHSGAPVLTSDYRLIGMADGATGKEDSDSFAWAIHITDIPKERYNPNGPRIAKLQGLAIPELTSLVWNIKDTRPQAHAAKPIKRGYNAFNFPKARPLLTLGGTLSRPFWLTNDRVQANQVFQYLNGRFDGYVELAPVRNFAVGFYLSSRYLQYRILRPFEYNIPLNAERTVRQIKMYDSHGLQVSWLLSQGTIHNAYIGVGYRPAFKKDDENFNYRGFIGYRLYPRKQRRFGLEGRIMYIGQDFLDYRQTLGIARQQIQTLKQWYVCAGLSHSIYRLN